MEEIKENLEPTAQETAAEAEDIQPDAAPTPENDDKDAKKKEYMAKMRMNDQYKVLGTGSYFWTMVLFCIPVLGQFVCIIMALGGSHYRNKVHFARAWLLFSILSALIGVGLYMLGDIVCANIMADVDNFLVSSGIGYPTDFTKLDEWVKALEQVPAVHDFLLQLNGAVTIIN